MYAFVALKALQWALKGQELASDTPKILLANAYQLNPCWKVDEQCHIPAGRTSPKGTCFGLAARAFYCCLYAMF